ncbi:MAG: CHASE2 domain-containing protein, partial [Bryobacteraceae bacterium]
MAGGIEWLHFAGALDWLENRSADLRVRATASPARASDRIVIVDIDNASFRALTDKLGRWPWTRRVWTELVRYIARGEPRLVLFDILFSGAEPAADEEFARAVERAGNVVLPFAFVSGKVETGADIFTPPARAEALGVARHPRAPELTRAAWSLNSPVRPIADAADRLGANPWMPDPDGITRRLPLTVRYEGRDWSTLWLAAAKRAQAGAGTGIPLDGAGHYIVRW